MSIFLRLELKFVIEFFLSIIEIINFFKSPKSWVVWTMIHVLKITELGF